MKTLSLTASALLLLVAAPVLAGVTPGFSNHPDAICSGTNPVGNSICCVTDAGTGTKFCLNNVDSPTTGFNDPGATVLPATGNPGTTLGQQRVNAYMESFKIWAATITTPETIWVQGTFGTPLFCDSTSATLGAAGTNQIFANFDDDGGPSWPTTWYHGALANLLADEDLGPGGPDPGLLAPPYADDIVSFFNGDLGNTGCLDGTSWYYGFDGLEDPADIDFLAVLTHEVNHGLGFANFIDEDGSPSGCFSTGTCAAPPGSGPLGWPDIYTVFSRDWNTGTHWNQKDDGERFISGISDELVWDGPNVFAAVPSYLGPGIAVRENSPTSQTFRAQASSYSPAPTPGGTTDDVVLWTDPLGDGTGDPHDACPGFGDPWGPGFPTTAPVCDPAVSGKIALIHRGSCNFNWKSMVAEECGATGVIIANNQPTGLPPMGGGTCLGDWGFLPWAISCTVDSVGIARSAGVALEADIAGGTTNVTILEDAATLAGADRGGFPRLYAPNPVAPGSSVSHWDTTLTPSALMEPFITAGLDVNTTLDLSPAQLMDIGWNGAINCPVGSDDSSTIVIDGCDTGVSNDFGPWTLIGGPKGKGWKTTSGTVNGGCYLADLIAGCVDQTTNHGDFNACADNVANQLRKAGIISPADSDAIKACAEPADLP